MLPFDLWPRQRQVLDQMEHERLLVILKARQLGISWLACGYALWLCTQHAGRSVLLFSQGQLEANELIERISFMYQQHQRRARLPALQVDNKQELEWDNGSNIKSLPATRKAGRSFTGSLVIFDEFAFMLFGGALYDAAKPTIDDGGRLWIISSADGPGSAYHQFWQAAAAGQNGYTPIFLPWQTRPSRGPDWRDRKIVEAYGDTSGVLREYPENADEAFTHAAGRALDTWSHGPSDGNVTEAADYVRGGGDVLWGVDDGYVGKLDPATGQYAAGSHPRVFLLAQQRPNGQLCIFAEHYACGKREDEHITAVLEMGYPAPDHAVVDKSAATLKRWLHDADVTTVNGPASVDESLKEVRGALALDSNGFRRVLVHPRCAHLTWEMSAYRRDGAGKIIKEHDHGPDALRYLYWSVRQG